jgi:hypothetical protein
VSLIMVALASAFPNIDAIHIHHHSRPGCPKTYTVAMGERAARYIYRGTRHVTMKNYRALGRYEMCQRNKRRDQPVVRAYDRHQWLLHRERVIEANRQWSSAIASWYDDSGTTGCGFHTTYGIATFTVGCGGHVILRGPGGEVTATRDDSGPYVSGRAFDLNPTTKAALGCSDLCSVEYSIP